MLNAEILRFSPAGRVMVSLIEPTIHFNGGTPTLNDGTLCGSLEDPDSFVAGFGYFDDKICARDTPTEEYSTGGLGRAGIGNLALALTEPIVGYISGLPVTADGRLAVELVLPPPTATRAFSIGFDEGFA